MFFDRPLRVRRRALHSNETKEDREQKPRLLCLTVLTWQHRATAAQVDVPTHLLPHIDSTRHDGFVCELVNSWIVLPPPPRLEQTFSSTVPRCVKCDRTVTKHTHSYFPTDWLMTSGLGPASGASTKFYCLSLLNCHLLVSGRRAVFLTKTLLLLLKILHNCEDVFHFLFHYIAHLKKFSRFLFSTKLPRYVTWTLPISLLMCYYVRYSYTSLTWSLS